MKNKVLLISALCFSVLILFFFNENNQRQSNRENIRITSTENYDRNKTKDCSWKRKKFLFNYDLGRKKQCQDSIHLLNSLNLTYFLGYGSALGAVRNKGLIKGDNDIDVIIPIWLNSHLFGCSEYERVTEHKYDESEMFIEYNYKICGHNKGYYLDILADLLRSKNITIHRRYRNIHVYADKLFIDMWVFMSEEGIYRDISICKCYFCGVESYSVEKAIEYSKISYGKNCMTIPRATKGKLRMEFDNPNKLHSYLKYWVFKILGLG